MALGENGMEIVPFVGRQEELKALKQLLQKKQQVLLLLKDAVVLEKAA